MTSHYVPEGHKQPNVAVIMPIKAPAPWLDETLDSIRGQIYRDFRLVCIVDGYDKEIVSRLACEPAISILISREPQGAAAARGRAVASSSWAEYIAPLDADDVWLPNHLSEALKTFESEPDIVLVASDAAVVDTHGEIIGSLRVPANRDLKRRLLWRNQFINSATVFRRDSALEVGSYDAEVRVCEDYDLWLRIGTQGRMLPSSGRMTVRYRVHPSGLSNTEIPAESIRRVGRSRSALAHHLGAPTLLPNFVQFLWKVHLRLKQIRRVWRSK